MLIFTVLVTACSISTPASAQGFNCRYAKTPDEVRICRSHHLRSEDERMSERYYRIRDQVGVAERRSLMRGQRDWQEARDEDLIGSRFSAGNDRARCQVKLPNKIIWSWCYSETRVLT
jgi:uncharacterized protein